MWWTVIMWTVMAVGQALSLSHGIHGQWSYVGVSCALIAMLGIVLGPADPSVPHGGTARDSE